MHFDVAVFIWKVILRAYIHLLWTGAQYVFASWVTSQSHFCPRQKTSEFNIFSQEPNFLGLTNVDLKHFGFGVTCTYTVLLTTWGWYWMDHASNMMYVSLQLCEPCWGLFKFGDMGIKTYTIIIHNNVVGVRCFLKWCHNNRKKNI